jgi:hypothetical protein
MFSEKLARLCAVEAIEAATAVQADMLLDGEVEFTEERIRELASNFAEDFAQEFSEMVIEQIKNIKFRAEIQTKVVVD